MQGVPRWVEIPVALVLVAMAAWFGATQLERAAPPPAPPPSPAPAAPSPAGARFAPPFTLPGLRGGEVSYRQGEGPLLLLLVAATCGECASRGPTDNEAYTLASGRKVPVWTLVVWGDQAAAQVLVERSGRQADRYLVDASGGVAVGQLGGSDQSCWILLGPTGEIAWQGPADLAALGAALDALGPPPAAPSPGAPAEDPANVLPPASASPAGPAQGNLERGPAYRPLAARDPQPRDR